MRTLVRHCLLPLRLVPRNSAPTAGPAAPSTPWPSTPWPSTQWPPMFSGLNSPIRGRSLTSDHTACGLAATSVLSEIVSSTAKR